MGELTRVRWLAAPPSLDLAQGLRTRGITLVPDPERHDVVVLDVTAWRHGSPATSSGGPTLLLVGPGDEDRLEALLASLPSSTVVESVHTHPSLLARRMHQLAGSPAQDLDPLTSAVNRRGLQRWLRRHEGEDLVVVHLDVDHMKQVNERWGFEVGDQVLAALGRHLADLVPPTGVLGRPGDDEFVVATRKGETAPRLFAELIRRGAALEDVMLGGATRGDVASIRLSSGVTSGSDDVDVLMEQAHVALVAAKAHGRDRTVDYDELRLATSEAFEERAFEDMTLVAAQRAAEVIASGGRRMFSLLRDEAETDPLTGLGNRRSFDKRLQWELREAVEARRPVTLILIDIDNFGAFNKRFSYVVGDSVLRHVAHVLRDIVGDTGWVARWGGEEFAVVMPHTTLEEGSAVAERLRAGVEVEDFVPEDRRRLAVTISAGVALWRPGESVAEVLARLSGGVALAKLTRNSVRLAPDSA